MEMHDENDPAWDQVDKVRGILRRGADQMIALGVRRDNVAIGGLYALLDIAELHAGEGLAAVEWMRSGCDLLEKSIMDGAGRKPDRNVN